MMWPLPALLAWGLAWLVFAALTAFGVATALAFAAATAVGAVLSVWATTPWRRVFVAGGFPLMVVASGAGAAWPAWVWLLPLALLALLYPVGTWRDAPLFPTPAGALRGLATLAPLPSAQPAIVDAGCGLGDGLRELHREYPTARLDGLERSWPLRLACAWRCRFARVRRADIWSADWSAYDSGLPVPAPREHGPRRRQGRTRVAPRGVAGQPRVRSGGPGTGARAALPGRAAGVALPVAVYGSPVPLNPAETLGDDRPLGAPPLVATARPTLCRARR